MARRKNVEYLFVDGYNIIFAWKALKKLADSSLEDARKKLLEMLSDFQGFSGFEIVVVFDAHNVKDNTGSIEHYDNLTAVYTKEDETADNYIERCTYLLARDYKVRVATSDNLEQVMVMGRGAIRISAMELYEEVVASKQIQENDYITKRPVKRNQLFDNLDKNLQRELTRLIRQEEK